MNSDLTADLERRIAATRADISRLRDARGPGDGPAMETLIAELARLSAARTRLMLRQRFVRA